MSTVPVRIILVDDHKIVREAWKDIFNTHSRIEVIGECEDGQSAIEMAKTLLPDIMVVDINMSSMNGFVLTEKILEAHPSVKMIALSVNNLPKYAMKMLELGGKGYLTKTSSLDEITTGIMKVFEGGTYICEEVRKKMPPTR